MKLTDYLVPVQTKANICFECQKACGGCSWSELDPNTNQPRWEPVPGWTAQKVILQDGHTRKYHHPIETYHITACPEFEADKKRDCSVGEITDEQFSLMLARWKRLGEF